MKRIFLQLSLVGIFLLMFVCSFALANNYTLSNGYYWQNGQAYTRSVVTSYDAKNCPVYSYKYTAVAQAAPAIAAKPDWRSKLLEIASEQKRYENNLKAASSEHGDYMEALQALGLNGSLGNNYVSKQVYSQQAAPQGQTIYGYNEIADIYGNVDLGGLYNSAIRLAENSNRYGAEATSGVQKLVDNFGDRASGLMSQQLAIAEINAKTNGVTNAARALGDALKPEARAHIERRFGHGQQPTPQPPQPQQPQQGGSPILDEPSAQSDNSRFDKVTALVGQKCVNCHGGRTTEANLDLTDLSKLDEAVAGKILARITSSDPAKRMPPSKQLTTDEMRTFFDATR